MSNIVNLDCITRLDLPADRIIEAAVGQLDKVIIVGYDLEGREYFASSVAGGADCVWLLERAKKRLLDMVDD